MVNPSPSASTSAPAVGMVLGARYRLERALGAGGMAEVFEGTDLSTGQRVAVKVLRPHLAESAEAVLRFRREGQVLAALKNPAVVGIEAVQELTDGRVFIVMELLEGETLGARMKRGALSANQLAPIVAGCAAGLAAAHAHGVVHRDLKPDNIFLSRLPNGDDQLKLLDFGVSKVRGEEKLTQTGQVLGTPRYMSPEQLGAEADIDGRVDVYALGVILYEALSGGKSPFLASTPTDLIVAILNGKVVPLRSVQANVPPALEAVVLRAMAKVRSARYTSAPELAEAFFEAGDIQPKAAPKQLGTSALGSMRTVAFGGELLAPSAPPSPAGHVAGGHGGGGHAEGEYGQGAGLAQGTFSELPAFDVRPAQRGTLEPQESSPAGPIVARMSLPEAHPEARPASPRAIPPTSLSPAVVLPEPTVGPTEPTAHPIASTRPQLGGRGDESRRYPAARHDPSGAVSQLPPEPLPMSRLPSGLVLIVVGLLAGALAAGAVIATLTWLQQASGSMPEVPPPPPPMLVTPPDAGPDAPSPAAAMGAIVDEVEERSGRTTTGASAGASAASRAGEAAATTAEGASGGTPATSAGAGTEAPTREREPASPTTRATGAGSTRGGAPTESEGVDPVIAATRALARGDARECVDILDEVIASGGTPLALRRRADCLARLGDMREAIRDYQRFCRVVPDHPAITEVREILEGLGQSCP